MTAVLSRLEMIVCRVIYIPGPHDPPTTKRIHELTKSPRLTPYSVNCDKVKVSLTADIDDLHPDEVHASRPMHLIVEGSQDEHHAFEVRTEYAAADDYDDWKSNVYAKLARLPWCCRISPHASSKEGSMEWIEKGQLVLNPGEWQSLITTHEDAPCDGTDRVNEYFMMESLGKGAFAKVKRCERRVENAQPRPFAAKIMSKSALQRMKEYVRVGESMRAVTALDKVEAEIEVMRTLYHRNIVLLFEVINDPGSDKIYLILEYMSTGPCMVYNSVSKAFHSPITRGPLTEEWAKQHMRDIVQGVKYLHARGVCHRDIKPDNILLNADNRCHISDFGCAQSFLPVDKITNTLGTYQFYAPECCSGDPFDPFAADAWAIGVTLYVFLFGVLPFDAATPKDLFDALLQDPVPIPSTAFSPLCMNFLEFSLHKDPSKRMTVLSMELHPWLAIPDEDEPLSF
ncbi:hypothetical protein DYB36_006247 [Aphanomyces astaci]|uniref:Protein kinase domain-containing protein n=1 Tax=Aphanomyces astaci TaxID=112090 RepID=A0A397A6G5_APHAT|nr:hypothetical protein DYB36_006247 [Aphanomyces astaci]